MSAQQLITEHVDLWTSSIKAKNTQGRGSSKKRELYGIKKLRELILELAVRGKLVPQDPNDEPANVLLERIAKEKAQLIKDKKVKKQKYLPEISEEEKPYALPHGWGWLRLANAGHDLGQKTPEDDFTYVDVGCINKELGVIGEPKVLCASEAPSRARKIVKNGTVIYSTVRPYLLNIAVINDDFYPEPIASTAFAILHPFSGITASFIYRYLRSPTFITYVESVQTGIAYPAINDKQFFSGILPIPPTSEQHRIVAKVDELMALCDQLEHQTESSLDAHNLLIDTLLATLTNVHDAKELSDNWVRLADHFDTFITTDYAVEQLKQTILQLAVQGKLVPQDLNDEPASELLKRIAAEKEQLVKDKKIKKQKPLPEITDEEKPFDLPEGWAVERLGTFTIVGTGATPSRSNPRYWEPGDVNWASSGETSALFLGATKEKVSELAIKETNVSVYPVGTLVVAMYGQGKTRGQVTELTVEAGTNQACAAIRLVDSSEYHRRYIKLFFQKSYSELRKQAAGGAQPNLNVGKIAGTILLLPPLEEQKRIVAKVGELMTLSDQLKFHINNAQTTQLHLADAVVENALVV